MSDIDKALEKLTTIEQGISSVPYLNVPMHEVWASLRELRGYLEQQLEDATGDAGEEKT